MKMIEGVVKYRPHTAAQDKLSPPGNAYNSSSAQLIQRGKVGTTEFSNLLASMAFPHQDSVSGPLRVDVIYTRTSPVGDADWEALPIGSLCWQLTVVAKAVTDAELYFKTINGYEKLLTSADADWSDLITVSAIVTAGAGTYTAAQIQGGVIRRDPTGAARTDTTSTAALMVAAVDSAAVGSSLRFQVKNTADANELITLAGGAGVTLSPTDVFIKPGQTKEFLVVFTNVTSGTEAATLYDMDQFKDFVSKISIADVTAGASTLTAVNLYNGGVIRRDPTGADRSDVTPTAALLVAQIPDARVGSTFEFEIINTADADEVITLTAGVGVTLSPTSITIGRNQSKKFLAECTNVTAASEAVTIYDVESLGHANVNVREFTRKVTVSALAGGAVTVTAAQLLGGYITNDPAADVALTLPTAALLVAAIPNCQVGSSFKCVIENTGDADEEMTLTLGAGATLTLSSAIIGVDMRREFMMVITNVGTPAYTVYDVNEIGFSAITCAQLTKRTVVTAGGGGAITITAAQLLGGYLQNDPAGAVNATTDTATAIIAAIPNCQVGSSFEFILENTANGAEVTTIVGGAGVTLETGHDFTPTQNEAVKLLFVVTNVGTPAITVYGLGVFTS